MDKSGSFKAGVMAALEAMRDWEERAQKKGDAVELVQKVIVILQDASRCSQAYATYDCRESIREAIGLLEELTKELENG